MKKEKAEKPGNESAPDVPKEKIISALDSVKNEFGEKIAANVEKIYRLETANFKSTQFRKTYTAGMEKFGDKFPWGWGNLAKFVEKYPEFDGKFSTHSYTEGGTGKTKHYIKFPSVKGAFMFLAYVLKERGNNPGKWHSTKPERIDAYNAAISKFTTPYLNELK